MNCVLVSTSSHSHCWSGCGWPVWEESPDVLCAGGQTGVRWDFDQNWGSGQSEGQGREDSAALGSTQGESRF